MNSNLNILFCGFLYDWNFPIINNLKAKLNVSNVIHIGSKNILIDKNYKPNFSREDLKFGYFYRNIDWNQIPPLDNEILSNFYECEVRVMEMISRTNANMSFYERKELYYKNLRYWLWVIKENKINLFISDNIPHEVFDYIIYKICKYMNIKTLMFHELPSRPFRHVMIHLVENIETLGIDIYEKYKLTLKSDDNFDLESLQDELKNYIDDMKKDASDLVQFTQKKIRKNFIINSINFVYKNYHSIIESLKSEINYYPNKDDNFIQKIIFLFEIIIKKIINLFLRIWENICIALNLKTSASKFYNDNCLKNPNLNIKYIYFPLHYQPELSTSPLAENYFTQELIIESLSKSAPDNIEIYVKDHPRLSFNRTVSFYKKILLMPNVKLLPTNVNSYKLIDNSIAVATATGSVGWESFHRNKPVIMFGRRFYQYAPGIFKVNSVDDCANIIKNIISDKNDYKPLKEKYLFSLNQFAFRGFNSLTKKNISSISNEENIMNHTNKIIENILKKNR